MANERDDEKFGEQSETGQQGQQPSGQQGQQSEFGQQGQPEAFAAKLHEVLAQDD